MNLDTIGDTQKITATTTPVGGEVTWASSDSTVATVSTDGTVTATGTGIATITATFEEHTAKAWVSVDCTPMIYEGTLLVPGVGDTQIGFVNYEQPFLGEVYTDPGHEEVVFESSNPDVVTVTTEWIDERGTVEEEPRVGWYTTWTFGEPGTAIVKAKIKDYEPAEISTMFRVYPEFNITVTPNDTDTIQIPINGSTTITIELESEDENYSLGSYIETLPEKAEVVEDTTSPTTHTYTITPAQDTQVGDTDAIDLNYVTNYEGLTVSAEQYKGFSIEYIAGA